MLSFKTKMIRSTLILSASVVALTVSGCKHIDGPTKVAGWSLVDPAERHPIMVSQEPSILRIHANAGANGLNPRQRAEIIGFVRQYRATDAGNSKVVIAAPSGSANEVAAMHAVEEMRYILDQEGFSPSDVAIEAYYDDHNPQPPIRLSYTRYVAEGPECRNFPTNLARQKDNLRYADFGCSSQRNLAAQIANPADLLGPRTLGPRAAERRDVTFGKWVQGETTSASRTNDERVDTRDSN